MVNCRYKIIKGYYCDECWDMHVYSICTNKSINPIYLECESCSHYKKLLNKENENIRVLNSEFNRYCNEHYNEILLYGLIDISSLFDTEEEKILKKYPTLMEKYTDKEILLINSAMKGNKVNEDKLKKLARKLDYTDTYEILLSTPRIMLTDKKIKQLEKLEEEHLNIENLIEQKYDELYDDYEKIVEKENESTIVICPFCNNHINITGDKTARCSGCEFSISLSTVSDKLDEYIIHHNLFDKPLILVVKLQEKEKHLPRYIRARNLIEIIANEKILEINKKE